MSPRFGPEMSLEGHGHVEEVVRHLKLGGATGQDAAEVDGVECQLGSAFAAGEAATRFAGEVKLVRAAVPVGPLLDDIGNQPTVVVGC